MGPQSEGRSKVHPQSSGTPQELIFVDEVGSRNPFHGTTVDGSEMPAWITWDL